MMVTVLIVLVFCVIPTWNFPTTTVVTDSTVLGVISVADLAFSNGSTFTTVTTPSRVSSPHSVKDSMVFEVTSTAHLAFSNGSTFTTVTTPSSVTGLRCEYSWANRALILVWDAVHGVQSKYEVQVNAESPQIINETRYQIDDVLSAEQYDISVTSLSGDMRSSPVSIKCQTKLRGVIIGSVVAVLIIVFIIGLVLLFFCEVHSKLSIFSRSLENSHDIAYQQRKNQIRINTSTLNIQDYQNSESECTDMTTDGDHQYEALNVTTRENTPYESCHTPQIFNEASVKERSTTDVDIYENI